LEAAVKTVINLFSDWTSSCQISCRRLYSLVAALSARFQQVQMARERGESTVPSTLGEEKHTNPFLRYDQPAIIQTLRDTGKLSHAEPVAAVAAFAALREWKNSFR
jgi:hydroxyacylglutathione hydrolase